MTKRGQEVLASFTPKQQQLVLLVSLGMSNKAIAEHVSCSEQAIKNCLRSIFDKAGVNSRAELMIFSFSQGIVKCPCAARAETIAAV